MNDAPPRLELSRVSKSFGGIRALRDVDWVVRPGEVHALLGENGAGKSTIVKIVTGIQAADSGEVRLDGAPVAFRSPMAARAAGIVAVYQDPKLFPHLDVAENIFMGLHPRSAFGTVDRGAMRDRAKAILTELDSDLDPSAMVAGLSIGDVQFVEFARALVAGVDKVLILDEPTAALTPAETERLFRVVRRFRDRGVSVVLISHRLEDLEDLVDTVTVLRDGERVATRPAAELTSSDVVRMMVGRSLGELYQRDADAAPRILGETRIEVENLGQAGIFDDVSFKVRAGEIVCMAGLVGAGRSEVAQSIFGMTPPTAGRVRVDGVEVFPRSPGQMLRLGLAFVPEDRDGEGLVTSLSIARNISMSVIDRLARAGILSPRRETALAERYGAELSIKAASVRQVVASLSGGNRQKVVLGKWLATDPKVLILDEPTHGIDVGTKAQVHGLIERLAAQGLAILVISSDLPEVLRLGDRVLVMADGRLKADLTRGEATEESVMSAASWRRRRAA
jgi:rhamnose transport system ATP-binding protein